MNRIFVSKLLTGWAGRLSQAVPVAAVLAFAASGGAARAAGPTVAITSPRSGADVTAPVAFAGTAGEAHATITAVNYWITNLNTSLGASPVLSGQAALVAGSDGTYNWSITASPAAGENILAVQSQDGSGTLSATTRIKFFAVSPAPLSVTVSGTYGAAGSVEIRTNGSSPVLPANGVMLNVGQVYTLVETPSVGVFARWVGNSSFVPVGSTTGRTLDFIMEPNTAVTANFITNIFEQMSGTYYGLFSSPEVGVPTDETSGMIGGLAVGRHGSYSAAIYLGGSAKGISGNFSADGFATNTMTNTLDGTVQLLLSVNFNTNTNAARLITGTVVGTNSIMVGNVTQTGWTSSVLTVASLTNIQSYGAFTMLIPPGTATDGSQFTNGYGFATVTNIPQVDGIPGTMRFIGVLADWTGFVDEAPINETNTVPIYQNYFNTPDPGMLFGWLNVSSNDPGLSGTLTWVRKPTRYEFGVQTNGFTNNDIAVQGSLWHATNRTLDYLSSTNTVADPLPGSQLILAAGDLTNSPFVIDLGVRSNSVTFVSRGGDKEFYTGSINTNTGRFSVEFTNAYQVRRIGYGVILQNTNSYGTNIGAGFFIMGPPRNPTNIGSINITPK